MKRERKRAFQPTILILWICISLVLFFLSNVTATALLSCALRPPRVSPLYIFLHLTSRSRPNRLCTILMQYYVVGTTQSSDSIATFLISSFISHLTNELRHTRHKCADECGYFVLKLRNRKTTITKREKQATRANTADMEVWEIDLHSRSNGKYLAIVRPQTRGRRKCSWDRRTSQTKRSTASCLM